MHSRIFQVSAKPISREEWITKEQAFNERYMDYCDDMGDGCSSPQWLVELSHGAFTWDGEALTVCDIKPLLEAWHESIEQCVAYIKEAGIAAGTLRWSLKHSVSSPLDDFLFYIEDWTGYTSRSDEFVDWVAYKFKPGDKIYIGAIFDYHY